jgi:acetylornithine deacetylase
MWKQQIKHWVTTHQEEILQFNRELVAIPSINLCNDGGEAAAQAYIQAALKRMDCEVDVFLPTDVEGIEEHSAYLKHRNYANRPNVVGRKKGSGGGRSLMFSGHIDTVPLADGKWSVDPFAGVVSDGKQYGLGLFDMKAGLAAAILALQAIEDIGVLLQGDVLLESVVDEEFGGANGTLACRLRGYTADLAIVPEPTNMIVCPQHQGGAMYRVSYSGQPGRGFSGEQMISPVSAGARFIEFFAKFQTYHGYKKAPNPYFDGQSLPAYIQGIKAGYTPLSLFDRSPASCEIDVWIQCYPDTTEKELLADFTQFYETYAAQDPLLRHAEYQIQTLIRFLPGSYIPKGHLGLSVIEQVYNALEGEAPIVKAAPFACDAFMFNHLSETPAIIWGPKGGNAHAPDEYIEIDSFLLLIQGYAGLMIEWCGIKE